MVESQMDQDAATAAPVSECCVRGFKWEGTPAGRVESVSNHQVYVAGTNADRAVLLIHDLFGWSFPNVRLLADHYAAEVDATVYVPDFFDGEVLDFDALAAERWAEMDLHGMLTRNSRAVREPEILTFAAHLRRLHKKVGAVGYCYGGWAAFRLGAREHSPPLVDCVVVGHPSLLTRADVDGLAAPLKLLIPEFDPVFTPELRAHCFETLPKMGRPWAYEHFPGVAHACFIRGDERKPGERDAMVTGKDSAVYWLRRFL